MFSCSLKVELKQTEHQLHIRRIRLVTVVAVNWINAMPENTDYIVQGPYGPINFGPGEEGRQKMIDYQRSLAGESDPIFDDPAFNAQYGGTLPGGNRPWDDLWQRLGIGGSGLEGEPFGPVG